MPDTSIYSLIIYYQHLLTNHLLTSIYNQISKPFINSRDNPPDNYMFKVNNRNSRTRCEICSKLIIKTPERRHWRHVTLNMWSNF